MPAVRQIESEAALGHGGRGTGHLGPLVAGAAARNDRDHEQRRPPPHATDTSARAERSSRQRAPRSRARLHFGRRAVRCWTYYENMCSLPRPPETLSRHPVDVGQRSEAIILADLVKRGYRVLLPYGTNHRYDIVIDVGDRFLRAQCKTGRLRRGVIEFATQSTRANTRGVSTSRSTPTRLISSSSTVLIPTASMLSAS